MRANPAALRARREAKGHTQSSLSRATGLSQSNISRLERGPVEVLPTTAGPIAEALECAIEDITFPDEPEQVAS